MHAIDAFASALLLRLAWSSLQAAVLVAAVALLIRLRPGLPAAARCALWWLVGLQLLAGLAWHAPVPLRWLAATPAPVAAPATSVHGDSTSQGLPLATPAALHATAPSGTLSGAYLHHWQAGLLALWLAALALLLPRALAELRAAYALRRDAVPVDDPGLLALCGRRAEALGLRRHPALLASRQVHSPQVSGLLRPVILLPASLALDCADTAMALDHELAHLRRGDLWLAWVPALAQRLFFFHPLVRRAMHEYALYREAACDAQVLRQSGSAPQAYGRLLLRLGVGHPLHAGLAGASPTFENLKRRLTMLQQTDPSSRLRGWLLVALVAAVGVVPYRVTATEPAHDATPAATAAPAAAAAAASAAAPAAAAAQDAEPMPAPPAPPPPPPVAPPAPPAPPPPPNMAFGGYSHVDIDTDNHARNAFALFAGDSVTISGTDGDVAIARAQRKGDEPMLWVRRGDQSYVIRDAATIARAKAIYAPVVALSKQQGELGGRQGELGGRQGGLGAQQGELGRQQAALAMERAGLIGRRDATARVAALQSREQDLEARQAELGKRQAELGEQQAALGHQQAELAMRQQEASTRASHDIATLIDDALAKGLARQVPLR